MWPKSPKASCRPSLKFRLAGSNLEGAAGSYIAELTNPVTTVYGAYDLS